MTETNINCERFRTSSSKYKAQRTQKIMEKMELRLHRIRSSINQSQVSDDLSGLHVRKPSECQERRVRPIHSAINADETMAMVVPSLVLSSGDNDSSYFFPTFTEDEISSSLAHEVQVSLPVNSKITKEQEQWMQMRSRRLLLDGKQNYATLLEQYQQQTYEDSFTESKVQSQQLTQRKRLLQKFGF